MPAKACRMINGSRSPAGAFLETGAAADTWGFRCCGQSPGADALRWGNLRLEGGEYIFLPCESAVSALSPDA